MSATLRWRIGRDDGVRSIWREAPDIEAVLLENGMLRGLGKQPYGFDLVPVIEIPLDRIGQIEFGDSAMGSLDNESLESAGRHRAPAVLKIDGVRFERDS